MDSSTQQNVALGLVQAGASLLNDSLTSTERVEIAKKSAALVFDLVIGLTETTTVAPGLKVPVATDYLEAIKPEAPIAPKTKIKARKRQRSTSFPGTSMLATKFWNAGSDLSRFDLTIGPGHVEWYMNQPLVIERSSGVRSADVFYAILTAWKIKGEATTDLVSRFSGMAKSNIPKHVRALAKAGLVTYRTEEYSRQWLISPTVEAIRKYDRIAAEVQKDD
jgi:DNA-binding transcriptional ArsR family regulator